MKHRLTKFWITSLLIAGLAAAAPENFNIPAQPAQDALLAFSKQARVEVLFSSAEIKLLTSTPVVGRFTPEEALALLLKDSGFSPVQLPSGKFIIKKAAPPVSLPRPVETPPSAPPAETSVQEPGNSDIIKLANFVVTPSQFGVGDERTTPNVTFTHADLQPLPQIGEDLYRTINRLPGLSGNDYTARFLVRGAPNEQVLSRYDGVDLIEPFHLKEYDGALSIIDLDTVGTIDLSTGGFAADYGDHLAGVFNIETKSSPVPDMRTVLSLSVTALRATSQGQFGADGHQWMGSARRGYIDLALKLGGNKVKAAPVYYDAAAKLQFRLSPAHTLSFHVLRAGDRFKGEDDDPLYHGNYGSTYVWGRWKASFTENLSAETVLSYSRISWHRDATGKYDEVDIIENPSPLHPLSLQDNRKFNSANLRSNCTWTPSEKFLLRSGIETSDEAATYDYHLSRVRYAIDDGALGTRTLERDGNTRPEGRHLGAFISPRFRVGPAVVVEPGLRYDHQSWTGDTDWSPRCNASFTLGRSVLRAGWGLYHQAQALHALSLQDGENAFHPSEKSEHRIISLAHRFNTKTELRIEAYQRLGSRLRPRWVNLTEPFEYVPESLYDRTMIQPENARARGVEIFLDHRNPRGFGWGVGYTYAINEERILGKWTPCYWDQRHTFYLDVTYVPAPGWQLSAAWQIHTGWPYTDQIFYLQRLSDGSDVYSWYYGQLNGMRAPAYHRLDLRATRTFQLKDGVLKVFVDVWNAYDHKNKVGFSSHSASVSDGRLVIDKSPGRMLGILPIAGISLEF